MSNNMAELMIAAAPVRAAIPKDKSLEERVAFAMRYVREHERDLFWMSYEVNDDMMIRTALAAVIQGSSEEERETITRSMQPLRMLSALLSGIPVDMSQLDTDNILPIAKMWNDSKP